MFLSATDLALFALTEPTVSCTAWRLSACCTQQQQRQTAHEQGFEGYQKAEAGLSWGGLRKPTSAKPSCTAGKRKGVNVMLLDLRDTPSRAWGVG
jgi:hypothetical protein